MKNIQTRVVEKLETQFNPLHAELNPICHLLALLGAHHIFHVSGLRVNAQKIFFFENCAVYEIMWKNLVQRGRPLGTCTFHVGYLRLL